MRNDAKQYETRRLTRKLDNVTVDWATMTITEYQNNSPYTRRYYVHDGILCTIWINVITVVFDLFVTHNRVVTPTPPPNVSASCCWPSTKTCRYVRKTKLCSAGDDEWAISATGDNNCCRRGLHFARVWNRFTARATCTGFFLCPDILLCCFGRSVDFSRPLGMRAKHSESVA